MSTKITRKIRRKLKKSRKKITAYTCIVLTGWASPSAYVHHEIISYLLSNTIAHSQPVTENDYTISTDKALEMLHNLTVHAKVTGAKYQRIAEFGEPWTDNNDDLYGHNGCDTRNDILTRDLTNITYRTTRSGHTSCAVVSGILHEPYTGRTVFFHRGKRHGQSDTVQIDHIVALKNAWQSGAYKLTERERINLANDPLNLLAVDGTENIKKRDNDASGYLPKNTAFRCEYVKRQIEVKTKYHLTVTSSEKTAIERVLNHC